MPNNYPDDFMVDLIRFIRRAPSPDEAIEIVGKLFPREDVFDADGQGTQGQRRHYRNLTGASGVIHLLALQRPPHGLALIAPIPV